MKSVFGIRTVIDPIKEIQRRASIIQDSKLRGIEKATGTFDVEGYEWHALKGAEDTIRRCKPMIQVELREGPLARHGSSSDCVRAWLKERGYRQVSKQPGSDFVFEAAA